MRSIRFRAWHKRYNRFIVLEKIHFGENGPKAVYERDELSPTTPYIYSIEWIELMAYTGLKDQNGREIYEGDIVKFCPQSPRSEELPNPQYGEMGEVFFDIGSFAVRPIDRKREGLEFFLDELGEWVVVGNIYENKELLDE